MSAAKTNIVVNGEELSPVESPFLKNRKTVNKMNAAQLEKKEALYKASQQAQKDLSNAVAAYKVLLAKERNEKVEEKLLNKENDLLKFYAVVQSKAKEMNDLCT